MTAKKALLRALRQTFAGAMLVSQRGVTQL
jgi:hypothetical protein